MQRIRERFSDRDVAFFLLYSREEHPGAPWRQTYRIRQRIAQARKAAGLLRTTATVLVEPPGETVRASYGLKPNLLYVMDRDGVIVLIQQWSFPPAVERMLERLLGRQAPAPRDQGELHGPAGAPHDPPGGW
ncbi:MAG: hypothetical protein ACE5HU_00105 [Acidobacteriota bacterium]